MGYTIHQLSSSFRIPSVHKAAALAALKNLGGRETCGGYAGQKHFMWINNSSEFLNAHSLEEALGVWRWPAVNDDEGGITELMFTGESLGDEDLFFSALAPYANEGSSIAVVGEDGAVWRWYFREGKVQRQNGKLVFED